MKILLASSEVVPFAKTGGLADVAGALPKFLQKLGHDVRVIMPSYRGITDGKKILKDFTVNIDGWSAIAEVRQTVFPTTSIPVYLVENKKYFDRPELYSTNGKDYPDNAERFAFYSMTALQFCKSTGWQPDVIHCNDWQTALIPVYLKTILAEDPFFKRIGTVMTIHNLAYQGLATRDKVHLLGFADHHFTPDLLEFYGKLNLLKGGMVLSDMLTTVSKTYSKEIQTAEFGCGLEGLLKTRAKELYGILNGLDYTVWNPETDPDITHHYSADRLIDKQLNKAQLQKLFNLPTRPDIPVIGMISRLDKQKGFDLIHRDIEKILELNIQFVLLGTGDPEYHKIFKALQKKHPEHVSVALRFDNSAAKKIYAGSDLFLMPSRYEPCGLGQLISLRYGTIPIVRATGGLADTITDYDKNKRSSNGFVFHDYTQEALLDAVCRAVCVFREKTAWTKLMKRAMESDFSWELSAKDYVRIYKKAVLKRGKTAV